MRGKILIVDDEQIMCEMLADDLKRHGFQPTWCISSEKALDILKTQSFDVLLADLNLPNMNGIELCERVVANRPDIPVIVITAFGSMETVIAAIREEHTISSTNPSIRNSLSWPSTAPSNTAASRKR